MNLAPQLLKRLGFERLRVVRAFIAFALITLLATASSVQADPVRVNQVVQTLNTYQGPSDLTLVTTQDPGSSNAKGTTGPRSDTPIVSQVSSDPKLDALLSGFPIISDPQKLGVEVVEEAEVEGTICDCGEILIPGGAFPKWPLLFLAAVPLIFINDCDDCDENPSSSPTPTPPSTPTPTPTPPAVPEPASLLLFGTGLLAFGAGLRRRYSKAKAAEINDSTEGE